MNEGRKTTCLWDGGFADAMHPVLHELSCSLHQDLPLADADLMASAAWALALARCGVLDRADAERLAVTLGEMRSDLAAGRWIPAEVEDIHSAIEIEATRRLGPLGQRLHTGRSRNEQVATAFRMAVREQCDWILHGLGELQQALLQRAEAEVDTLLPAYTHVQRAQPVRLAHWLLSHFWPLGRDVERVVAARRRADVLPLGSGAAIGNAFGIDREWLASRLGFHAATANSLDAVGDRDFAVEFAFACALVATHLSRLAEDLVLWSSAEFGYVRWPDSLATGSSLMPNKKNPDLVELVRGRAAAAVGDVVSLLVLLKGLPSCYQRDLQEDKPPVWRTAQAVRTSLAAMAAAIQGIDFGRERMRDALSDDVLATEAADALVRRGVPFREAHAAVSRAVATARARGVPLRSLAAADLPAPLAAADLAGLDFEPAVERRGLPGGTGRDAVLQQLAAARAVLEGSS
jgi:argininosuccinate lyase